YTCDDDSQCPQDAARDRTPVCVAPDAANPNTKFCRYPCQADADCPAELETTCDLQAGLCRTL
ncbi:hypothetical protein KKF91_04970, partial [Myxococcota bacterium]|nr:hypothetical protein [Myxococcota bacterium]MBU1429899.1 hypothetical protein [Myxococcota bacterium]MBU1898219.1 hypothetical protein [Myxococcota bacterium]